MPKSNLGKSADRGPIAECQIDSQVLAIPRKADMITKIHRLALLLATSAGIIAATSATVQAASTTASPDSRAS